MPTKGDKIREDDPGITVGGVPLEQVVAEEERKEKENDVRDTRRQEIGTKAKHKKQFRPRERYGADPRRVKGRVRRLSEFEIRKEYGVMKKPFASLTQNVFFVLFQAGDTMIGSRAIADETGRALPDVSSALSNIFKKMKGDDAIYREKLGLAFQYKIPLEHRQIGFDTLYQKYFPGPGGVRTTGPVITERMGQWADIDLPYKVASHNIIHLICTTKGESFRTRELAEGVGKPAANISSAMQSLIKRLQPHGMLHLTGSFSSRTYRLDERLANATSKDMIEFIFGHKRHWDKGKDQAWKYWTDRLMGARVEEPPAEVEPAPIVPTGLEQAIYNLTEKFGEIESRVIKMEDDGVEQLAQFTQLAESAKSALQSVGKTPTLSGAAPTNEFTINLRFLFGRAS